MSSLPVFVSGSALAGGEPETVSSKEMVLMSLMGCRPPHLMAFVAAAQEAPWAWLSGALYTQQHHMLRGRPIRRAFAYGHPDGSQVTAGRLLTHGVISVRCKRARSNQRVRA